MPKKDISNKSDVHRLVRTFYSKIRAHQELGPIFEKVITDWEGHFDLLTDFWEAQLFLKRNYHGNPVRAHQEVDKKVNHSMKIFEARDL